MTKPECRSIPVFAAIYSENGGILFSNAGKKVKHAI